MSELIITSDGITVTATDGVRTRTHTCSRPCDARGLVTRLRTNPTFADKWLGPRPVLVNVPVVAAPSRCTVAMPIIRHDRTVRVYDGCGRLMRAFECRDVKNAVALETKLTSDPRFAREWASNGDPKGSDLQYHARERLR